MLTITPKYSSWSWSTSLTFKSRTKATNKNNWPPRKCRELRKWYLKAKRKKTRKHMAFWVRYFGGSPVKTWKIWSRCNRFFFQGATSWLGAWFDGGVSDIQVKDSRINLLSRIPVCIGTGYLSQTPAFCIWVPLIFVLVDDATSKFYINSLIPPLLFKEKWCKHCECTDLDLNDIFWPSLSWESSLLLVIQRWVFRLSDPLMVRENHHLFLDGGIEAL